MQFRLGFMYANGKGVPEDDVEAVRWLQLSAEQGEVGAQFHLGRMYDRGEGVREDNVEAIRWYRLAAEQGLSGAQFNLGLMYRWGEGTPEDLVEGYAWLSIAEAQGFNDAKDSKTLLANEMSAAQISKAKARVQEYWEDDVVWLRERGAVSPTE